ncbi:MAG TPA: sulfite exporter TauE/SafE family protein [Thermoanaerobaculia bacterium]|nr:sulfite exporter TauE/SafE family protein [Thermoanaerobaculia bacterium]
MIDLLIGCVAGIFIGATGIGAGSILTPLLILRGHDPLTAVTTGLLALIAARTVGSLQHVLSGHWPANHGSRVLIGGVAGAGLGFVIVQQMIVHATLFESALRMTLGVVLLSIGLTGFVSGILRKRVPAAGGGLIALAAVGTGTAVAATSAGSGTLLGVLVFPVTDWRVHEFSAVSNVFGLFAGLIGIAAYSRFGRFNPSLLGYVMAGSVIGIMVGVLASRRIQRTHFAIALRVLTIVLGLALIMA